MEETPTCSDTFSCNINRTRHCLPSTDGQVYYDSALAPNTKSTYSAGQQRFISFCKSARLLNMPASESTLLLFATHLANSNISYATIKMYLSAVRYMHVTVGMHNFFIQQLTPQLKQVLKVIQKSQPTHQEDVCQSLFKLWRTLCNSCCRGQSPT